MAHYSYKNVAYDIDPDKWESLGEEFKKIYKQEPDGDPNYAGDNWLLAEMWIRELITENKELKRKVRHKIKTRN